MAGKPVLQPDATAELQVMVEAARQAGQRLLQAAGRHTDLKFTEKTAGDFVSEADTAAEQTIANYLYQHFPDYGWLGEETGEQPGRGTDLRWIVDPLDGTKNFLRGIPHWAVSIALYDGPVARAGVVFDPNRDEMFTAEAGQGAFLNGDRLSVSQRVPLSAALLATGMPAGGRSTYLPNALDDLGKLMPQVSDLRRMGAAALDFAWVAAGRLDAYWERNLGPWDVAAGQLLVTEARGHVSPLWPDTTVLSSGSFIASNGGFDDSLVAAINTDRR